MDNSSQSGFSHAGKSKIQYSDNISTKETFEEFICATFPLSAKLSFSPATEMIALEPQKDFPVSVIGKNDISDNDSWCCDCLKFLFH